MSSSGIEPVGSTTSQASPSVSVISNASDAVTPAKTKFSFKKGGGGDALIARLYFAFYEFAWLQGERMQVAVPIFPVLPFMFSTGAI